MFILRHFCDHLIYATRNGDQGAFQALLTLGERNYTCRQFYFIFKIFRTCKKIQLNDYAKQKLKLIIKH